MFEERGPYRLARAGKAEIPRGIHEPVEMQLDERISAIPKYGFDERKPFRELGRTAREELGLKQAFAVLLGRVRNR